MAEQFSRNGQPANYNTTPATRSDGDPSGLEVDATGSLKVALVTGDIEIGGVEIKDGTTDARQAVKVDNATAGATPTVALTGGIYKATLDTYADNDASPIHTDVNGQVLVVPDGSSAANTARTTATVVQPVQQVSAAGAVDTLTTVTGVGTLTTLTGGGVAANAADSGNPIKVGGKYTAAGVTLDDGDRGDATLDAASNLNINQGTLISGEDQSADVMKVEHQYSITYQAAAADDVVVKAAAGFLHAIILGKWVTGGTLEVSDHATTGDANIVIKLTAGATDESGFPKTVLVDGVFAAGITADQTGLTDVTFIWR